MYGMCVVSFQHMYGTCTYVQAHKIWHDDDADSKIDDMGYPGMAEDFKRYIPRDPDYYELRGWVPVQTPYGTFWIGC
ncbi:hypothetical protein GPECTOR_12g511 [Gonium pectorale]|uniref:Uncharacterized protein n=1 Tax=Gonium pectorale TaxID=33097 RepID=A0A150GP84_GONPE|nr:hypothetical protein GPECTOR_12g511 [Gonium pectorale]|eukprot:KXZ51548.1 hypothetical protein GPECTOR_12g511 [Gonium pectorale]